MVEGVPVSLVSTTPGGSDETLTAILIETPSPSPAKQKLYRNQADPIIEEDEDEEGSRDSGNGAESPKDKLVKEGAYLKSRLWWFGLLLIATGEGGECSFVFVATKLISSGNFLSYGFAPASVVAPLGTVVSLRSIITGQSADVTGVDR